MKNIVKDEFLQEEKIEPKTKGEGRFKILRASLIAFVFFTIVCGLFYTFSVTIAAQALFPYEANGSLIEVTLADGTKKVYGSELIGQSYIRLDNNGMPVLLDDNDQQYLTKDEEYYQDTNKDFMLSEDETTKLAEDTKTYVMYQAQYLIGRNNSGAPSNASTTSEIYKEDLETRRDALIHIGYNSAYNEKVGVDGIPSEMITESGSGCDPEITYDAAIYQVKLIAETRQISEEEVTSIINKYTKRAFLGIFGSKRVNVLMVNLALDGMI